MLFILVMYVLNSLFIKTGAQGLLQSLSRGVTGQRLSLYADNIALFIKPVEEEMQIIDILMIFCDASRLETNLQNSNIIPIRWRNSLQQ
jgi:hypothetical protein